MAFIDSPRVKQLVTSISDETVSIADFFAAAMEQNSKAEKNVRPILTVLAKEGIDVNQPWTSLANEETVNILLQSEHTNSATFTNLQTIERETRTFYNKNKGAVEGSARYPFSDDAVRITGDGGIARSFGKKDDNPKAYQVRGTQKFKKVPKASITIPKILEAISVVKDDSTRAALTFNVLVPFRPGEVAELLIEDIDFDTGYISEYTRGNKTRPGLQVPKVALEILRDAAEDAQSKGSDKVFSGVTVNKMTTALKKEGKIVDLFKGSKASLGREIKGVKDLRKLVPSVLALELGKDAGVISQLLGHEEIGAIIADLNNMTKGYYVSPVDVDENAATQALETIQNIVGKNTNAQTLNEIPLAFRVSATNLTQEGAEQFDIPLDIIDQVKEPRVATPEDLEMQEARRKLNLSQIQKQTADIDIETENKRLEALERRKVADAATTDDLIGGIERELDKRDDISKKIQELEVKPDKTERELSVIEELRKKAKIKPKPDMPVSSMSPTQQKDFVSKNMRPWETMDQAEDRLLFNSSGTLDRETDTLSSLSQELKANLDAPPVVSPSPVADVETAGQITGKTIAGPFSMLPDQMSELTLTEDQIVPSGKTEGQRILDMLAEVRKKNVGQPNMPPDISAQGEPIPEFLQEGPAQDTPKKDSAWKKILKKVGSKLPYVGAAVGAAAMLREVMLEQEWQKKNAGRASIDDLDRSRRREQYFKLASLEEAVSPLPFTTGDKREVNIDKAVRKELETLPEFTQIQKSLSGLMEAKVGRSGPPLREMRARVDERKAMTKDITALAKRRSELEAKVRSAVDERNVMDLQGEIDYTKGTEGMQNGFVQQRSI